MIQRLTNPLKSNSFFLFGARGTGKTTFLKSFFSVMKTLWFDLLDLDTEDTLRRELKSFSQQIESQKNNFDWVVIDEVQKMPELLNEVHRWIEQENIKFALTGSSARKLKRGSANLLAGRAFINYMYPLTHIELGKEFNLDMALRWGTLPKVFSYDHDEEREAFLRAYTQIYLKEEIWMEHFIRNLDPFRKFLEISAQSNGEIINYSNIARDVGVDIKTVQSYFEILSDTLLGFFIEPYHLSLRKQQRMSPKFYLFDAGVKRALDRTLKQILIPKTFDYGKSFEHFLIAEVYRLNMYKQTDFKLYYLRTKEDAEIDLIIERGTDSTLLIEIKSKEFIDDRDVRTLERFLPNLKNAEAYAFSRDPREKKIGSVHCFPWEKGLQILFT